MNKAIPVVQKHMTYVPKSIGFDRPLPQTAKRIAPVVWAIDSSKLNEEEVRKFQNILEVLNYKNEEILTTSIFSPFEIGWLVPVDSGLKKKTLDNLIKITKDQWNKFSIPFKKNRVIISESGSIRDKVMTLIQFAKKHKAKVIAVGSGVTKRSQMTGLGSFSENLIALSPVPVLVMSESVKPITQVKKILFPTDFSEISLVNFKKVVQFAKNYNAEVILYHFMETETGPIMYGIPWGYEVNWLADYWQSQEEHKQAEGEKWKAWSEKQNIKCRFINDRKLGSLKDRILETAQENQVDILSVGIKRGPLSQVILGRKIRDLIAKSTCPILALHTTVEKKKLHS